jgi:hypothetical protein
VVVAVVAVAVVVVVGLSLEVVVETQVKRCYLPWIYFIWNNSNNNN